MRSHAVGVALLLSVSVLVAGVDEASADIRLRRTSYDYLENALPDVDLERIIFRIDSDEPIVEISNISIDGLVHQVFTNDGSFFKNPGPSVFLDDWEYPHFPPTYLRELDTHLLINRSSLADISGSPIVETIEQSTYYSYPWIGFGTFGQESDGTMTLLPEYQTTSLDLIQIVADSNGSSLSLKVRTTSQTYQARIYSPWGMNGPYGYIIASSDIDFSNIRVGTTATEEVTTSPNCWDQYIWWESRYSFPEVDAPFGLDSADDFRSACYSFSPQTRGQADNSADCLWSSNGQPDPDIGHLTFTGRGVGPVFSADQTPGTTLEFGDLQIDSFFDVFTEIGNLTDDPELGDLTSLTAFATIEGDVAGAFHLLDGDLLELLVGQTDQVHLRFNAAGLAPGEYQAQLVIQTDIGAAAGATDLGEVYSFPLHATVVPEPSTLAGLLGLVATGMLFDRRRKPLIHS